MGFNSSRSINKPEILTLISKNQKLQAIKKVRQQLGIGLKESKDIVDNLADNSNFYDNKPYTTTPPSLHAKNAFKTPKNRRGSHIIKTKSNFKNYVIFILISVIVMLIYLYVIK